MQIEELNDNELIYMIRQRNEKAFAFLVNKYQVEIRRWLRHILRTYPRYQDQEDFYQIALLNQLTTTKLINQVSIIIISRF